MEKYGFWWVSKYVRFLEQGGPSFSSLLGLGFPNWEVKTYEAFSHFCKISQTLHGRYLFWIEIKSSTFTISCETIVKKRNNFVVLLVKFLYLWENTWCQYEVT